MSMRHVIGTNSMKTAGLLKVYRGEDGKLVYERRADNLTAAILAEAERELKAMPQVVVLAEESRRRDSGKDAGEEVPDGADDWIGALEGLGYERKEARRRVERAIEEIRASGREVTGESVIGLACALGYGWRRPA